MTTPPPTQGQNPYAQGQSPQGGNPFAQGQPPQGYPQQPTAGYAPVPPAQPKRKVTFKLVKNVVTVVVVAVAVIGGYIASRDDANTAAVGDCMHRGNSSSTDPDLEVVECSSSQAQYIVLAKIEGSFTSATADSKCAAEAKDFQYSYTESGDGSDFLLCLKDYSK
ncbi:LppU/SCO3897 family protein [Streptomyces populi]